MAHLSKKLLLAAQLSAVYVGLLFTLAGCGSDSTPNYKAVCEASCDKLASCSQGTITAAECKTDGCTDTSIAACTNSAAVAEGANKCNAMTDCAAWLSCALTAPQCTGGGGNDASSSD
jgi:hypothetical protein